MRSRKGLARVHPGLQPPSPAAVVINDGLGLYRFGDRAKRLFSVERVEDFVGIPSEHAAHQAQQRRLVIHDQDPHSRLIWFARVGAWIVHAAEHTPAALQLAWAKAGPKVRPLTGSENKTKV